MCKVSNKCLLMMPIHTCHTLACVSVHLSHTSAHMHTPGLKSYVPLISEPLAQLYCRCVHREDTRLAPKVYFPGHHAPHAHAVSVLQHREVRCSRLAAPLPGRCKLIQRILPSLHSFLFLNCVSFFPASPSALSLLQRAGC